MNCPHCNSSRTKVTDSRPASYGRHRVRECLQCGKRHVTLEIIVRNVPNQGRHLIDDVRRSILLEALEELSDSVRRRLSPTIFDSISPLKER